MGAVWGPCQHAGGDDLGHVLASCRAGYRAGSARSGHRRTYPRSPARRTGATARSSSVVPTAPTAISKWAGQRRWPAGRAGRSCRWCPAVDKDLRLDRHVGFDLRLRRFDLCDWVCVWTTEGGTNRRAPSGWWSTAVSASTSSQSCVGAEAVRGGGRRPARTGHSARADPAICGFRAASAEVHAFTRVVFVDVQAGEDLGGRVRFRALQEREQQVPGLDAACPLGGDQCERPLEDDLGAARER
jgi:hypothetical protein